jgi:NADPH:quinone reductase-like Zn-dependent oxidoreductase
LHEGLVDQSGSYLKVKAIVLKTYGGPDHLQLIEVEKPSHGDDEVLVKVYAVSINDWDWGLMQGDFVNRMLNGFSKPKRQILGSDIAGRIEAVGKNITRFKTGDEVFGDLSGTWGGFAEYVCAREDTLGHKPAGMTFEQAASIPQAAMLAVQGLIDTGHVQSGQKILINGAGGGVGTFGLQILKPFGVEVTVVDTGVKLDMLRSLGAVQGIDYTKQDFTKTGQRYDLILDVKTNRSIFRYMSALKPGGKYITVGGSIPRLLQALLCSPLFSLCTGKKVSIVALKPNKDLDYMSKLFEAGQVRPILDGPYTLEDVPEAFRVFGRGEHKGKMVITVTSGK